MLYKNLEIIIFNLLFFSLYSLIYKLIYSESQIMKTKWMIDDDRRPHNVIKISGKKKGKSMKVETLLWNARENKGRHILNAH